MPIIVYNGPNKFFALSYRDKDGKKIGKPYTFDIGIPTWTPKALAAQAPKKMFKTLDEEGLKLYKSNRGRPVVVLLPSKDWMVYASITFLNKLKEFFPCNPIIVVTKPEFFPLIPDFCQKSAGINIAKAKPYREFDFKNIKESQYFNQFMLAISCLEDAFFAKTGMREPGVEHKGPVLRPRNPKFGNTVVVLADVDNVSNRPYWGGLADMIIEQGVGPFQYEVLPLEATTAEEMKTAYDALTSAFVVISCGDSPLFPIPLYHGIPTFAFLANSFPKVLFNQYKKYYGNYFYPAMIGEAKAESVHGMLTKKIQELTLKKSLEDVKGISDITVEDLQRLAERVKSFEEPESLVEATQAIIALSDEEAEPIELNREDEEDETERDPSGVGPEDGDPWEEDR